VLDPARPDVEHLQERAGPLLQGGGTRLFDGVGEPTRLGLTSARPFIGGAVVLTYVPGRR
jgi:hypothetical protein